jgi:hypothetical protein
MPPTHSETAVTAARVMVNSNGRQPLLSGDE